MPSSRGLSRSSFSAGIVFRYGVVALYGTAAPFRRASATTSSSKKNARSAPSYASTESSASSHSRVSAGSRSSSISVSSAGVLGDQSGRDAGLSRHTPPGCGMTEGTHSCTSILLRDMSGKEKEQSGQEPAAAAKGERW